MIERKKSVRCRIKLSLVWRIDQLLLLFCQQNTQNTRSFRILRRDYERERGREREGGGGGER
jgi:hypothetical protein